jgi:hypothetical protein
MPGTTITERTARRRLAQSSLVLRKQRGFGPGDPGYMVTDADRRVVAGGWPMPYALDLDGVAEVIADQQL